MYLHGFVLFTAACGLAPTLGGRRVRRRTLLAGVALAWRERRAAAPLVDVPMLAATGSWPLLAGALCA